MTGWIIYLEDDARKNVHYIEMHRERFKRYNVNLELITAKDGEELGEKVAKGNPDFVINRSRQAEAARILESRGICVFNNSEVTEIANDKAKSYRKLQGVVPFMPVEVENEKIESMIESNEVAYPCVIKSCAGHGGSQVYMAGNEAEARKIKKKLGDEKYVVQQMCSNVGKDVRVFVIGNQIVAAVLRTSTHSFKSNYSLGGKAEMYTLNDNEKEMVAKILEKMPADFVGIDFIFHNGTAVFNEIEDAAGSRMLYEISDIDIVQIFVDYIMGCIGKRG